MESQGLDRSLFNKQINRFYQVKRWSSDGIPTKEILNESGLDYVRQDLEHKGILTNDGDWDNKTTSVFGLPNPAWVS